MCWFNAWILTENVKFSNFNEIMSDTTLLLTDGHNFFVTNSVLVTDKPMFFFIHYKFFNVCNKPEHNKYS